MPDYPLSYSLQSHSRECVSYTDAPAHTGPKHSDNFIYHSSACVHACMHMCRVAVYCRMSGRAIANSWSDSLTWRRYAGRRRPYVINSQDFIPYHALIWAHPVSVCIHKDCYLLCYPLRCTRTRPGQMPSLWFWGQMPSLWFSDQICPHSGSGARCPHSGSGARCLHSGFRAKLCGTLRRSPHGAELSTPPTSK